MGHVEDRWFAERDGRKVPTVRHGKGRRYRVRYMIDGREKSGGSFERKIDAERALVRIEHDLLRGYWVDPRDVTTVTGAARAYIRARPHSPATRQRMESLVKVHIEGTALGSRRLAAVRRSEVQGWATDRGRVLAPSTLRLLVNLLRAVYAAAVQDHLVATSPVVQIALPRAERERVVPLTVAQVRALADAVDRRYRAMVLTQAGLGLRIGELLALRTIDVDFLRRTVRIDDQIDVRTGARVPPKTPRSRRALPLPGVVADALAEHLREFPPTADALIFHTSTGRPYGPHYAGQVFRRAVARAGLPAGTSSHALRHHYASLLLAGGESVVAVAERLGHESAKLVLSTYGHLLPNREDHTRRAVDDAWTADIDQSAQPVTAQGRPR